MQRPLLNFLPAEHVKQDLSASQSDKSMFLHIKRNRDMHLDKFINGDVQTLQSVSRVYYLCICAVLVTVVHCTESKQNQNTIYNTVSHFSAFMFVTH